MDVSRCCFPSSVRCGAGDESWGGSSAGMCECVWAYTAACFTSSHVDFFFFLLVCFWIPLRCAFHPWTTRQSGALWGLQSAKEKERRGEQWKKSRGETEKMGGRQSFERLLTSKLTVIVVLARGESTFKHTGWVRMWRDYKSKVIHNKQHRLCQLHEIGGEKFLEALEMSPNALWKRSFFFHSSTGSVIRFRKCGYSC